MRRVPEVREKRSRQVHWRGPHDATLDWQNTDERHDQLSHVSTAEIRRQLVMGCQAIASQGLWNRPHASMAARAQSCDKSPGAESNRGLWCSCRQAFRWRAEFMRLDELSKSTEIRLAELEASVRSAPRYCQGDLG